MAISNNGTQNLTPAAKLPAGYSRPSVTTFDTTGMYKSILSLSVLKSTVENAAPATTMANIISNGTIGITKQVDDILAADYLASATVTAFANIIDLTTNYKDETGSEVWLDNIAPSYVATVHLYVKAE